MAHTEMVSVKETTLAGCRSCEQADAADAAAVAAGAGAGGEHAEKRAAWQSHAEEDVYGCAVHAVRRRNQ